MVDPQRLLTAYEKVRLELLDQREPAGHWVGQLSTSALSTATAVSALALYRRHYRPEAEVAEDDSPHARLIVPGLRWLAAHQNKDGGWGDTDRSHSNVATTMLARAAFHLTGVPANHADLLARSGDYLERCGGMSALRKRYGRDRTFAVPILANCAMAGLVPWREVTPLPFELACVPQRFYRFLRLPVVSYAIPALVAIGQARYFHQQPWDPLRRSLRDSAVIPSLAVLERMQPDSGGYLEAVPLTSFVAMSLASIGRAEHPVTLRAVQFLVDSVRPDGSWPIDTNLATWNTTLGVNALASSGEDVGELVSHDWLLACQHRETHAFTGANPGGWGWSDLSGAVPDVDDTAGALLALAVIIRSPSLPEEARRRIDDAVEAGIRWLLALQNRNGGWPTFCRGWGKLPFDRSGSDLTAHALRALQAWNHRVNPRVFGKVTERGFGYLERHQHSDGSWSPLWFGNQDHPQEENPVYGTAKVLLAYADFNRLETPVGHRGLRWLSEAQNRDGGWGGRTLSEDGGDCVSSVEETALALDTFLRCQDSDQPLAPSLARGLEWLVAAVDTERYRECSPIGFYFAKLWYYERLYPTIFTVSALGRAVRRQLPQPDGSQARAHLTC